MDIKFERNYAGTEEITYEAGINEPVHPDFSVAMRFEEVAMSSCPSGCKIYADPRSRVRVLAHNRVYGCTVTT